MNVLRSNRFWIAGGYLCLLGTATLGVRSLRAVPDPVPLLPPMLVAADSVRTPAVAVVFQLEDCSGSIDRLAAWSALEDEGAARVYGFVLSPPGDDAQVRKTLDGSGIRFPVMAAPDQYFERVMATLGHRRTPLALVFDREGRVRMAVPLEGRSGAEDVRKAADAIRALAQPAKGGV